MTSSMGKEDLSHQVEKSQKYFNKLSLFFYDWILYGIISKYAWGCSTIRLDEHYRNYISNNHLEVGVGTGFLLNRVKFQSGDVRLGLMDLSQSCLQKTAKKVARYQPEIYQQNLLEPITNPIEPFDSISINYVMHCVPGGFKEKGIVFKHLKSLLNENGALFGTTVLFQGVPKGLFAKLVLAIMNKLGVFNNKHDSLEELRDCLSSNFSHVDLQVEGCTAVFVVKS
ncbi:class I SAM-dependent methyltransferase [Endozoicomonas sp. SM1973]|uniref:Class I SAM-dependent methyltransferase n=1 Tax=Spartinivicinus marinus TaxID=2994442 RepID=A0A853I1R1_9GAMM|nr:class I SAM-dependent methyltransferase [Spartinivicinus marinus]MCX4026076.1 class I SAM-dependent methyltransferase [Spartinivicinus marinus]NYZ66559.1 class I SAM-dependent methyltransferase [Spartinivicinus marinus]